MAILELSGVQEVAVVDANTENDGELLLTAFVVKKNGPSEEEICAYIRQKLAAHKQLNGGVVFIERLPRNEVCINS